MFILNIEAELLSIDDRSVWVVAVGVKILGGKKTVFHGPLFLLHKAFFSLSLRLSSF